MAELGERSMNLGDQRGDFVHGNAVVAHMGSDDVAGEGDEHFARVGFEIIHYQSLANPFGLGGLLLARLLPRPMDRSVRNCNCRGPVCK